MREFRALRVPKVTSAQLGFKALRVLLALKVPRVQKAQKVLKARKAQPVFKIWYFKGLGIPMLPMWKTM